MKAIVIGRHNDLSALVDGGIDILDRDENDNPRPRPIMFPADVEGCKALLEELLEEAQENNCALLFQAIPAQLAVALAHLGGGKVGAVINTPGPRLTAVSRSFAHDDPAVVGHVESMVKFVNPRAKIEEVDPHEVKISIDPFSPFVMSHIQWFSGETSHWQAKA